MEEAEVRIVMAILITVLIATLMWFAAPTTVGASDSVTRYGYGYGGASWQK